MVSVFFLDFTNYLKLIDFHIQSNMNSNMNQRYGNIDVKLD